jgi:hypothetical protein
MYVIPYNRDATPPMSAVTRKMVQKVSNLARFIYSPRAFQRVIVRRIRTGIFSVLLLTGSGNQKNRCYKISAFYIQSFGLYWHNRNIFPVLPWTKYTESGKFGVTKKVFPQTSCQIFHSHIVREPEKRKEICQKLFQKLNVRRHGKEWNEILVVPTSIQAKKIYIPRHSE